jgi:hypothetical protein
MYNVYNNCYRVKRDLGVVTRRNKQALMPLKHIVMHSGQDYVSSAASGLSQDRRA